MTGDTLKVATSGKTIPRHDACKACSRPMKYKVDEREHVQFAFCAEPLCEKFLVAVWPVRQEESR